MRTVKEVSKITGVSVRTLHHYDAIGLLKPSKVTEAGYRMYDDTALSRLQNILLFRELQFPLKEIKAILTVLILTRQKLLPSKSGCWNYNINTWGNFLPLPVKFKAKE